ncbi:MAG: S41 family peptidase [Chloroflexota bacterium]
MPVLLLVAALLVGAPPVGLRAASPAPVAAPAASPAPSALPASSPSPSSVPAPEPIDPADLPDGFARYLEVLRTIRESYVGADGLDDAALVEGSIRGLIGAIGDDGHSTWLSPDEVAAEDAALDGAVTGIGVLVDSRFGLPEIVSVVPGSPADAAGIGLGDRIVAVDGVPTERMGEGELVAAVRGPEGTVVSLVLRDPRGRTRTVPVTRARIEVPSTAWVRVPGTRTALIRLLQFSDSAGADVAAAVRAARDAGARSLVLDLRGNPGGLLDQAVAVSEVFLSSGTIYREVARDGSVREIAADGPVTDATLPLVVLVDGGSASSAEIVAAALGANGRARVVGERTFGTGTILGFFPLADGSGLRLGTYRWQTPGGEDLYGNGLLPGIVVPLEDGGRIADLADLARGPRAAERALAGDRQLRRALRLVADATRRLRRTTADATDAPVAPGAMGTGSAPRRFVLGPARG